MTMSDERVLFLPGWLISDHDDWQSRWQRQFGYQRVEQADWQWPRRGDWMARLDEVLLADPRPALLIAHSLGCQLVAAWSQHSQHTARVRGALNAHEATRAVDVAVECAGGQVTLRGIVADDAEKSAAEQVAQAVAGVRAVDNQLHAMSDARHFPTARR